VTSATLASDNVVLGALSAPNAVNMAQSVVIGSQAFTGAAGSTGNNSNNIIIGYNAANNYSNAGTGSGGNIIIGAGAVSGSFLMNSSYNIVIGTGANPPPYTGLIYIGFSPSQATQKCFIDGISGKSYGNSGAQVLVGTDSVTGITGLLGTISSSSRVKKNVKDMANTTHDIFKLRPVIFNYKEDEHNQHLEYGLIAEEVELIYPGIVIKDAENLPQTVQYQYLPIMMLNEQQKDHTRLDSLERAVQQLTHINKEYAENITSLQKQLTLLHNEIAALVALPANRRSFY
jgi:hypothetical protein